MYGAYEAISLLKLAEQIESIAAYGMYCFVIIVQIQYILLLFLFVLDDNLLVATRQRHLMMHLVTPIYDNSKYKIQVPRYHKTFSKKPIQQIEVIPGRNFIFKIAQLN